MGPRVPAMVIHQGEEIFIVIMGGNMVRSSKIYMKKLKDKGSSASLWGNASLGCLDMGQMEQRKCYLVENKMNWGYSPHLDKGHMSESVMPQQVILILSDKKECEEKHWVLLLVKLFTSDCE